jgi:hypothetical protein
MSATAIAVGASLCAFAPSASATPTFGFNESFAVPPAATDDRLNQAEADAGAEINRLTISWADVDHDRNSQNWAIYDRRIASIEAAGMQPVIILQGSPAWARTGLYCHSPRPVFCPPDDAHMSYWERFAYQVASRYPDAAAIEVWNEPNWYWPTNGGPDPERYARMYRLASGAVKFVDPSMPVLVGSLTYSHRGDVEGQRLSIPTWLRRFALAGGTSVMQSGDGIGIHPYPWIDELETLDTQFATIMRQIREQRNIWAPGKKIWVTETGATTTGPHATSERQQARTIIHLLNELSNDSDLGAVLIHTSVEPTPDPRNPAEVGSGVLKWDTLVAKLAYCTLLARAGGNWTNYPGCPADLVGATGLTSQQIGIPEVEPPPNDCAQTIRKLKARISQLKLRMASLGDRPRALKRVRAKLKTVRLRLRDTRQACAS